MRLLHVFTVPISLRLLRGQTAFMRERGFDLHVVTAPGPELESSARELGATPHEAPMSRAVAPVGDLAAIAELTALMRRIRPDIVHSHTPKGGMLGMIAARLTGVRARFYHMRGLPLLTATGVQRPILAGTERLSCGLAHRVFAVGPSLRDAAIDARLVRPDKIEVLGHGSSNGVDAAGRFDPDRLPATTRARLRADLGIPNDALVLGFVGRLALDKGVRELAAAFERIGRDFPDAHLLVVGPVDERDPIPPGLLERGERVHLAGMREDLAAYYAAMDVLLLPSHREGFPNVVLEAAAMRIPVVTTDAVGCRDAVVDGTTGSIVPVGDAGRLAEATLRYLRDPVLRWETGQRGRAMALERYRGEVIWAALHRAYLEQLARADRAD